MAFVKISELPIVDESFTPSVPFLTAGDVMPIVHGPITYKVALSTLNEYFNSLSAAGSEGQVQFNSHGKLSANGGFTYYDVQSSIAIGGLHKIEGDNSAAIGGKHSEVISDGSVSLGNNNSILHNNSFTIGANLTSTAPDFTYVNNIEVVGNAIVDSNLDVLQNTSVGGSLEVDGNATVIGNISAGGGVYYNEARPHLVYVSTGGSDTNVGTNPSQPFRTIKKACQYISEHQQLIFPYTQTIGVATNQYTIFVMTGDYIENNPIYVPQQTTIIGDSLRRTSIRPLNRTYDILWLNSACYVWGFTFRDHLEPAAACAFPNLDQTRPEFNIAFNTAGYEIYTGYNDYYRIQKPFISTSPYPQGNSSITYSEIAPQQPSIVQSISAQTYTPTGRFENTAASTVNTLYNGIIRTILAGTSGSAATIPTNPGNIPAGATTAISLLTTNRSTIQEAVTSWGKATYPLLWGNDSYKYYACYRDTGYMIDSIVADLQTGTNNRIVAAANVYFIGVLNSTGTPPSQPLPNALVYKAIWDYAYEFTVETYLNYLPAASAYVQSEFAVLTGILDQGYESIPYNTTYAVTTDAKRAALLLSSNRLFYQNELTAYVDNNYPGFAYGKNPPTEAAILAARAKCYRDMGWFVDALVSDLLSGTNARTITYANSYYVGASSRIPNQEVVTADTIDYAKYISSFVIGNSAVQTTPAGCGIRVDGGLVRGYLRSMVTDSFTQINEGGLGIHITNNGYAQLVSTFTICCREGVRADNGGTCSISTSNSTFGLSGLVAVGYSPVLVMSGKLSQNVIYNTDVMHVSGLWPRFDPPDYTTYTIPISAPYVGLIMEIQGDTPGTYYVLGSADIIDYDDYIYRIITVNPIKAEYYTNDIVKFYIRSVVASSSHAFEYIGSGTVLRDSIPALGGKANPFNEARASGGGAVYFTSTNHLGDFKVGNDFTIIQETGTIEGRIFKRAIIALVTPLTLSLE